MADNAAAAPLATRLKSNLSRLGIWLSDLLKRGMDIAVSVGAIIALAPVFAWIAWRIKRDSPGPVIYKGSRLGKGGRIFNILKFRTMYESPESYAGPRVTAYDDRRVTPFGRWLRVTKLNELPQFFNVVKGEMSLVGPRPEDPLIGASWPREAFREILSIRPGITSPATVFFRQEEEMLSHDRVVETYVESILLKKMDMDRRYVQMRSIRLDLIVLLLTLRVLIPRLSLGPPSSSNPAASAGGRKVADPEALADADEPAETEENR